MDKLKEIFEAIKADPQNINYTKEGIEPLYSVHKEAKICIIGQAPGIRAQESRLFWNDPSGERLRDWLGIDRETFYQSNKISILPLDFYFPGKGKSGDLPPRKGFAEKWHEQLLQQMPEIEFFVLVGSYAIKYYLNLKSSAKTSTGTRTSKKNCTINEINYKYINSNKKVTNRVVSNFFI